MSASRSHSMQVCQPKLFYTNSKIYSELFGKVFQSFSACAWLWAHEKDLDT